MKYNAKSKNNNNKKQNKSKELNLALIAYKAKRYEEAIKLLEPVDNKSDRAYEILELCYQQLDSNKKNKYSDKSNNSSKKKYENRELTLALVAYKIKRYDEAINILENATNKTSKIYKLLGDCYNRLNNESNAKINYEISLNLNSKDRYCLFELAKIYINEGKRNEAKRLLQSCAELYPKDIRSRMYIGKLYRFKGNDIEAEKAFKECLKIDRVNVYARLELGKVYAKQRKYKDAEKTFFEIINFDPSNLYARTELGKLYAKQGNNVEAEKLFKECLTMEPKGFHARIGLGKLYAEQGKESEAGKMFEECLNINPEVLFARIYLGKLYAKRGNDEKSREMYQYVYDNINFEEYDEDDIASKKRHIEKHLKDDLSKEKHGVFKMSIKEIREKINFEAMKKQIMFTSNLYCFKLENCGYEGGLKGDKHQLDYITIVTSPYKTDIITMFPSDEIILKAEIEKNKEDNER